MEDTSKTAPVQQDDDKEDVAEKLQKETVTDVDGKEEKESPQDKMPEGSLEKLEEKTASQDQQGLSPDSRQEPGSLDGGKGENNVDQEVETKQQSDEDTGTNQEKKPEEKSETKATHKSEGALDTHKKKERDRQAFSEGDIIVQTAKSKVNVSAEACPKTSIVHGISESVTTKASSRMGDMYSDKKRDVKIHSILITNTNEGLGFELMRCILEDKEYKPRFLFVCFREPTEDHVIHVRSFERQHPDTLRLVVLNTTRDEDIERAFEEVEHDVMEDEPNGLNILINNCGRADEDDEEPEHSGDDQPRQRKTSDWMGLEREKRRKLLEHFDKAVASAVMMCQIFQPLLIRASERNRHKPIGVERCVVINMCFQLGAVTKSSTVLNSCYYRASRAALDCVNQLLSNELGNHSIIVAGIVPGWAEVGPTEIDDLDDSEYDDAAETANKLWSTILNLTEDRSGLMINYDNLVLPW